MFENLQKAYQNGENYAHLKQFSDLPSYVGSLNNDHTYKDYRERLRQANFIESDFMKYSLLEIIAFKSGQKQEPKKKVERLQQRKKREELRDQIISYKGLAQSIEDWFYNVASPFLTGGTKEQSKYEGYIKDYCLGLTEDNLLEASLTSIRVTDEVSAEKDFISMFEQCDFSRIILPEYIQRDTSGKETRGLYYFNLPKELKENLGIL